MNKNHSYIGILIGTVNSLFGAGGGMLTVPYLTKHGLSQKQAHASSLTVILPLSILSCMLFLKSGAVSAAEVLPFLPGGILGAAIGATIFRKIPANLLKVLFSIFMYYAAIRMILS